MHRFVFAFVFLQENFHKFSKFINGKKRKNQSVFFTRPTCSPLIQTTCMFTSGSTNMFTIDSGNKFTSDSANMFANDLANMSTNDLAIMFTCDLENMFTSDLDNMFTSDLTNMFTSDLAKMFTSDLANMFTCHWPTLKMEENVWPTCSLVKLAGEYVGLVPGIQHLIQGIQGLYIYLFYTFWQLYFKLTVVTSG